MADVKTAQFKEGAKAALASPQIQRNLAQFTVRFNAARETLASATDNWEAMRTRAKEIKQHTLENLDYYLEMLEGNVIRLGGHVFFAKDTAEANQYVLKLARDKGVKLVTKGKSMVSEEMGINHALHDVGIEALETDLGEYIIQLAQETPFHILVPAIHKSKEEVSALFEEKLSSEPTDSIPELTETARQTLREKFFAADMGITGVNFAVAETGTITIVTNEGNGRMCTSMPRIHTAIMGMEKIVPSLEDLGVFIRLITAAATGQRISSYLTFVNGPRRADDEDGPEEFHLVIVDNGRYRMLKDPQLREALECIRCGACLNACPVYRKVGGHSYGWVYSGPIGKIVTPMLSGLSEAKDLPFASTLCGACREACPVKIDIPRMLLYLRSELNEGATYPREKRPSITEKALVKLWAATVRSPALFRLSTRLASLLQRPLLRSGRLKWLPPPFSGWTKHRDFPAVASKTFHDRWRQGIGKGDGKDGTK